MKGREGRIILVRHGQTAWSRQRYTGWEDVPLDDVGKRQSQKIALLLAQKRIDAIYSSPLIRAVETIRPLAEQRGLSVILVDELKEIHCGQWQGSLKAEHKLKIKKHHLSLPLPDGESLFDVYRRVRRFTETLEEDLAAGCALVIVGHFWSNRMLVGTICRNTFNAIIDQSDYRPGSGSLFELRCVIDSDGEVQVLSRGFIGRDLEETLRYDEC